MKGSRKFRITDIYLFTFASLVFTVVLLVLTVSDDMEKLIGVSIVLYQN